MIVRDLGDFLEVDDFERRIRHGFNENGARFVIDRFGEILRIVRIDELHLDAEGRKNVVELRVGAAIEVASTDDIVARRGEIDDRVKNATGAGGDPEPAHFRGTFEQGDAFFQHVSGRIH